MATLSVEAGKLIVTLSGWEKLGAARRANVAVPIVSIVSVARLDNARHGIRGMRAPGTGWPGYIALGTWRTFHTIDFVAVNRNDPGYMIELKNERFDRLVLSSVAIPELEAMI